MHQVVHKLLHIVIRAIAIELLCGEERRRANVEQLLHGTEEEGQNLVQFLSQEMKTI